MTIIEIEQKLREMDDEFKLGYNELLKALAELKESKKEKWKPQIGEKYWFRSTDNFIGWLIYNFQGDEWRINNLPIFPTEEECVRYWHFMDTVKEKSYEFSKEEWENQDINKYTIFYRFQDKEWNIGYDWSTKFFGKIYFKTKEDAQYIIDNFKEELMEYWI